MKKIIALLFLSAVVTLTVPSKIHCAVHSVNIENEKKLIIDLKSASRETFEALKEELSGWREKVKAVEINESNNHFILIHYASLDNRELYDLLKKYNIQKESILSYE